MQKYICVLCDFTIAIQSTLLRNFPTVQQDCERKVSRFFFHLILGPPTIIVISYFGLFDLFCNYLVFTHMNFQSKITISLQPTYRSNHYYIYHEMNSFQILQFSFCKAFYTQFRMAFDTGILLIKQPLLFFICLLSFSRLSLSILNCQIF